MYPYNLVTDRSEDEPKKVLTIVIDGEQKTVKGSAVDKVLEAIRAGDEEAVKASVSVATHIEKASHGLFTAEGDEVFIDGQKVPESLGLKILEFYEENLPYKPLIAFWKRLRLNPSHRSVQCLYNFLNHNKVPLTEDGCFVAYKGVKSNFRDIRSGEFDNSPGKVVSMPRNEVDDDPEHHCSNGLHVAGWDYAAGTAYGRADKYIEVKVSPQHVVAVPSDYDFQKMRVCEYYVVKEVPNKPPNIVSGVVYGDEYLNDSDWEDYYGDEDDKEDYYGDDDEGPYNPDGDDECEDDEDYDNWEDEDYDNWEDEDDEDLDDFHPNNVD